MATIKSSARTAQTLGNATDDTVAPTYLDRGQNVQVQRPEHQAVKVADAAGTDAASVNGIRNAIIAAGIMKSA